ncbi:hypothetical protein [Polaribacter sp. SA4-12]|uniref:hypothetical protein n=1 Tax=Polaribacter sp. SA4-12 TaxID=1312072 RepID=UPI000B3C1FCF|nr:hypothetical protein [Polaribacter sp. SA4-12]ARV16626.1 hypothetical protein BTO07_16440 [Polaribacter sp. SA4-12]
MEDYNAKDNSLTKNSLTLLDRQQSDLERLKKDRITDHSLYRTLTHYQAENEKLRILINENPRFEWIQVQNETDRLFSNDKNMGSVNIRLTWNANGSLGYITGKLVKTS